MATEISHSQTTAVPPEAIWPWYADTTRWSRWDGGVSSVELNGPFATGTRGRVMLPNGRRGKLRLLDVQPGAAYTDVLRLALLTVTTQHELTPEGTGTRITHRVRLGGVFGRFFPRLTAMPVRSSLPASVAQLAILAAREPVG